jgi:TIR domain
VGAASGSRTDTATPSARSRSKIFVSYRRRESAGYAGWLHADLVKHFGAERVFMDVGMEPGVDFRDTIDDALSSCGALVVLIGDEWLTVTDDQGRRRIDDPEDVHRMEIEAALDAGVRLIPALVMDARVPEADELPERLRPLVRRQAVELSNDSWDYDVGRLVGVLERVLLEQEGAGWLTRVRAGLTRAAKRRRALAGFLAGVVTTLAVVGALLAATGQFASPLLEIGSYRYNPPRGESSIATCRVEVRSDYVIQSVHFFVDGNPRNALEPQTRAPWQCNNTGKRNAWDTCKGNSAFRLDDGDPHTLTVRAEDVKGNTAEKTRPVTTNCPRGGS